MCTTSNVFFSSAFSGTVQFFNVTNAAISGGLFICTKEKNSFGTFDTGLYSVDYLFSYNNVQLTPYDFNVVTGSIRKIFSISGSATESCRPKKLFSAQGELYLASGYVEKSGSVYFESNHWQIHKFPNILYAPLTLTGTQNVGLSRSYYVNYFAPTITQYSIQESINYDFREQGTFKDYILPYAAFYNASKGYYLVGGVVSGNLNSTDTAFSNSINTGVIYKYTYDVNSQQSYIPFSSSRGFKVVQGLQPKFFDANNNPISALNVASILGETSGTFNKKLNTSLSFIIETGSNVSINNFTASGLFVGFRDNSNASTSLYNGISSSYQNINNQMQFNQQNVNQYLAHTNFMSGASLQYPFINVNAAQFMVEFSSSTTGTFDINNVVLQFEQPLTQDGITFYKNLDNDNENNILSYYNFPMNTSALADYDEWPHYGGLFQMKNLVLGTLDSGKIGNDNNSILQVFHIGSTVMIMWPPKANQDNLLQGLANSSAGQGPGKMSTIKQYGDFMDVSQYDHMALSCYAQKQVAGTSDTIIITVETRPTSNTGFAPDQVVQYNTSGSVVNAQMMDLQYTKVIDYSDLSTPQVSWTIDVPLTNAKELYVSARQLNGQADDRNKTLVVYGRFIKKSTTTNET
jgi:hypothetical protein